MQLLAKETRKSAEHAPGAWALATDVEDPDGAWDGSLLSLPVCDYVFQMYKPI